MGHTPDFRTNVKFHNPEPLRIDDEPSLLNEGPACSSSSWACKAKGKSRTLPSPPSAAGHRARSRVTKPRNKQKVLDKNLLAAAVFPEISGVTEANPTATSHGSSSELAIPVFPSPSSGLQDETAYGPQLSLSEVGLFPQNGTYGTLGMNNQVAPAFGAPQYPPVLDQNQFYPWTWGHLDDPPPTETVPAAWEGVRPPYINPEACVPVHYPDGAFGAAGLPYCDDYSHLSLVDNPYSFAIPGQEIISGEVGATSYMMYKEGNNTWILPIRGIQNGTEILSTAEQWVMVNNLRDTQETSDVEVCDVSPPSLTNDGTPSPPFHDLSPDDAIVTPESHSPEGGAETKSESSPETSDGDSKSPTAKSDGRKPNARRPLQEDKRQQTSATRKLKACIRCRMQKIRVSHSSNIDTSSHRFRLPQLLTVT